MIKRTGHPRREGNELGATLIEYVLCVSFIAITLITAVTKLGEESSDTFFRVGDTIARASDGYDPTISGGGGPPPPPPPPP
jgi:Flp pilus assembly pilin Flp